MEARVRDLEGLVAQLQGDLAERTQGMDKMTDNCKSIETQLEELQSRNLQMKSTLASAMSSIQKEKEDFMDAVGVKLAQGENQIGVIIQEATKRFDQIEGGAREKFDQVEHDLREIYQRTAISVKELETRVSGLERGGGGGDRDGKSYLPQKSILPKIFEDKLEEWRRWTEDVADYIDTQCKGVKEVRYIDSMHLSWRVWGRKGLSHSLDRLCSRLRVSRRGLRRHDARGDVALSARCVVKLLSRLKKRQETFQLRVYTGKLPAPQQSPHRQAQRS